MSGDFTALKSPEILFTSAMSREHKPRRRSHGSTKSGRSAAVHPDSSGG